MGEDEMVRYHHQLNGRECEQTLERVEDRGAWHAAAHGVTKSGTQLSDCTATRISWKLAVTEKLCVSKEWHLFGLGISNKFFN